MLFLTPRHYLQAHLQVVFSLCFVQFTVACRHTGLTRHGNHSALKLNAIFSGSEVYIKVSLSFSEDIAASVSSIGAISMELCGVEN